MGARSGGGGSGSGFGSRSGGGRGGYMTPTQTYNKALGELKSGKPVTLNNRFGTANITYNKSTGNYKVVKKSGSGFSRTETVLGDRGLKVFLGGNGYQY